MFSVALFALIGSIHETTYVRILGDENIASNNDDLVYMGDASMFTNTSDTQVIGENHFISNSYDSSVMGRNFRILNSTNVALVGTGINVSHGQDVVLVGTQLASNNDTEIVIVGRNNAPAHGALFVVGAGTLSQPSNAIEVFPDKVLMQGIDVIEHISNLRRDVDRLEAQLVALSLATSGTCECSVLKDAYLNIGCCPQT